MSGKRSNSPGPLCRFTFADGRQCRSLAQPDFDGLCYHHGTASRPENLSRELAPMMRNSPRPSEVLHAERALLRAVREGTIPRNPFYALQRLVDLIRLTGRYAHDEQFSAGRGPFWDAIRKLLDRDDNEPDSGH
jgi:hypothetical protein